MKTLIAIFCAIFAGIVLFKALVMWYEYAPEAFKIFCMFLIALLLVKAAIAFFLSK